MSGVCSLGVTYSCWHLLQIVWHAGASSGGHRYGNHWVLVNDCREGTPWPPSCSSVTSRMSSWQYEPSISISLDPIRSIWLANNLQQTCVWSKLSPHGYKHLTQISSTQGNKHFYHRDKCINVSVDYLEVWLVPSATHVPYICKTQNKLVNIRLLPNYLKLPCTEFM